MNHDDVVKRVNRVFLQEFDVTEEMLKPEARLIEDLGLDSLDGVDLVVAIEKEFEDSGVKIKEVDVRKLSTLEAIYAFVESRNPVQNER